MTCAGISSLIITGLKRFQGQESLAGDQIQNCGKGGVNARLQRGIDWLAGHFRVGENYGSGQQWRYYYQSVGRGARPVRAVSAAWTGRCGRTARRRPAP